MLGFRVWIPGILGLAVECLGHGLQGLGVRILGFGVLIWALLVGQGSGPIKGVRRPPGKPEVESCQHG